MKTQRQREKLLTELNRYGYELFSPDSGSDAYRVLADMVRSHDARILEGFPVVLANMLNRYGQSLNFRTVEKLLRKAQDRKLFRELMELSAQVYGHSSLGALTLVLPDEFQGQQKYTEQLNHNTVVDLPAGVSLMPERVLNTFRNYYVHGSLETEAQKRAVLKEQLRTEYNLSLLFSPKQKDLLMKRLRGERLTKTEREYFSRTVKKKLTALLDPDVQRMAQKALS